MSDYNAIIMESLMTDDRVKGFCLSPYLGNPDNEKEDMMWFYRLSARIPEQTHSCNVGIAISDRRLYADTDALLTFEPGLCVGVKTADCVPILVYAPDKKGVGAIHAGWKGTLGGIVDNVMDALIDNEVDPTQLKVAFGPSISKDVYEVSSELAQSFVDAGFGDYVSHPNGVNEKPHIDLQGVNMERFIRRGVKPENIRRHSGCSYSSTMMDGTPMYASHRRSGGAPARMLTCIMLLSPDS